MSFPSLKDVRVVGAVVLIILTVGLIVGSYFLTRSPALFIVGQHQRIAASSPLRLSFPEPMDHASVEKNLTLPDGVQASLQWDGEELVLQPKSLLNEGKTYVVTVGGAAKKTSGQSLGGDMDFTFIVAGAPVVSARIPAPDAKDVGAKTDIVIVFDRPVVPLTQVQGAKAASRWTDWPVTISPSLKGHWRWLGTTTATFVLDQPLTEATAYTVTVPKGVKMVSGELTEQDFSWTFQTERPRVLSVSPNGSTMEGPTTNIIVQFNHEMDLVTAKKSISLSLSALQPISVTPSDKEAVQSSVSINTLKFGTKEENGKSVQDRTQIIVVPEKSLQFSKSYSLTIGKDLAGKTGTLGTSDTYTAQFSTVGEFIALKGSYDDSRLSLSFTSPPDVVMLTGSSISFSPELKTWKSTSCYLYSAEVSCFPLLKPSTQYTVTVKTSLKDAFGQTLKKPLTFTFKTKPITPEAFIYPRGKEFSIFEQNRPPVFYLNHVNVSALDVEVGQLSLEAFRKIRMDRRDSGYTPFDLKSVSDNVRSWHIESLGKPDTWTIKTFDLQERLKDLSSGIYVMTLTAPEWKDSQGNPQVEQRFFALTNLGVTLKYSGKSALIWVTDLQTGEPVPGASVTFSTLAGTTPIKGTTDAQGFFETSGKIASLGDFSNYSQPEFWVSVEKDGESSFIASTWNNGFQPYDFSDVYSNFLSPVAPKFRLQSIITTDRPIYKAGDTVEMKGILRLLDADGVMHLPAKDRQVQLTVSDAESKTIVDEAVSINDFGSFTFTLPLTKESSLGWYNISAAVTGNDVEGSAYGNFNVQAYRKPEYSSSVVVGRTSYLNHETLTGSVTGQYYFGAPMAGAAVKWLALYTDYYFSPKLDDYYSFSDYQWCYQNCERKQHPSTEGTAKLDASGRLSLSVPLNIDDQPVSQVVTIEADLTDENNQLVSASADAVVHRTGVYVGIRSADEVVESGKDATISVITLKPDETAAPKTKVTLSLFKRTWNVIQEKGVDGDYYYDSKPEDTLVTTTDVTTDDKGKAKASFTLPDGGQFHVTAVAKDDAGSQSKAGWDLYAWSDMYVNWPHSNNDRIDILSDKTVYKPGDTAKLLVKTPYQGKGVKALVTVERENVITKKIIDVHSNALPIEVPITEDLLPTAYVSVVIMKPRIGETFDANGKDTGTPAFKIGYIKLPIDTSSKKLSISIETNKKRYLPREKVTVNLRTLDASGKPVATELSLAVVDMSLLDLTGYSMPDLVSTFYTQRGLGVITANMLTYLVERFKPGSKGGGGGDGTGVRGDFRDTAYWNPSIVTNAAGEATVSFTLPDNLTTWHLEALGSTKKHLFGGEATTLIETKDVIVRSVRPRFAVIGDKISLGAIVHNETAEPKTFDVTLSGSGFVQKGSAAQKVTVDPGKRTKVLFPIVVSDAASLTMRFAAVAEGARDIIEETIPLYRFGMIQSNATAGMTEDRADEKVFVPSEKDAESGSLTVQVAPTLATYLPESLSYLSTYPYGCAEQVTSSIYPSIALKQLNGLSTFSVVDNETLQLNVLAGLQKIYAFQRGDGGFGYWENSPESYPSLTAYIVSALTEAKKAGYGVDGDAKDRAIQYLQNALHDQRPERQLSLAERVEILYTLSEEGISDLPSLNDAFDKRRDLSAFSRAELAMAYDRSGGSREKDKARRLLTEVMNSVRVDARGVHMEDTQSYWFMMHSGDRATAIVLRAAVRIDPENPFVWKMVRGMLASRMDGHWDTTQSTSLSILALVDYLKQTKELESSYTFAATVDAAEVLKGTVVPGTLKQSTKTVPFSSLKREKDLGIAIAKTGNGRLYYDLLLKYFYTPDEIQPAEEGIGIVREMLPVNPTDKESVKAGDVRKIRLTITVPETRHFVAVESMLAAGFEPIDMQYAISQQQLNDATNNSGDYYKNQTWRFSHIELRDDRVFLFADELPPGVYRYEYLVRATTPGTFRERPARVFEMYFPENFGQTGGGWVTVGE